MSTHLKLIEFITKYKALKRLIARDSINNLILVNTNTKYQMTNMIINGQF